MKENHVHVASLQAWLLKIPTRPSGYDFPSMYVRGGVKTLRMDFYKHSPAGADAVRH